MKPYILSNQSWTDLALFMAKHEEIREVFGLHEHLVSSEYGLDTCLDRLAGTLNIWPEWAREALDRAEEESSQAI